MSEEQTLAKKLKDHLEALEKCRQLRVQLKQKLNRDGMPEEQEAELAEELHNINQLIGRLEKDKKKLVSEEVMTHREDKEKSDKKK